MMVGDLLPLEFKMLIPPSSHHKILKSFLVQGILTFLRDVVKVDSPATSCHASVSLPLQLSTQEVVKSCRATENMNLADSESLVTTRSAVHARTIEEKLVFLFGTCDLC